MQPRDKERAALLEIILCPIGSCLPNILTARVERNGKN
jgi:hypothetical protein